MDYLVKDNQQELFIEHQVTELKTNILQAYIAIRKEKGLTQQDIADRTGMHRTNVVRIESGRNVPTIENLVKLGRAVGMELRMEWVEAGDGDGKY